MRAAGAAVMHWGIKCRRWLWVHGTSFENLIRESRKYESAEVDRGGLCVDWSNLVAGASGNELLGHRHDRPSRRGRCDAIRNMGRRHNGQLEHERRWDGNS